MSFDKQKPIIEEGDTVILYLGLNSLHALKVEPQAKNKHNALVDNVFQTTFGALRVKSLIGQKFGSRIMLSKGWGYVLHPTPELWTVTLPHRTQIIYTPDISMILFQLELKPGCIVIESGTGSGSLSHALIRAIKPTGHLYTYDFHEHRASVAQAEFRFHGLSDYVSVSHRDVCQNGFGTDLDGKADAVFLDLPHPWEAVPHAVTTFKTFGGRLCSFSPCVEQVQRTADQLKALGFVEVVTLEILLTEYHVATRTLPVLDISLIKDDNSTSTMTKDPIKYISSQAPSTLAGHTGYLTVATLPPLWARASNPQDSANGT